jgi:hypothetical protein
MHGITLGLTSAKQEATVKVLLDANKKTLTVLVAGKEQ